MREVDKVMMAPLGLGKGMEFEPDARQQRILVEGATLGELMLRNLQVNPHYGRKRPPAARRPHLPASRARRCTGREFWPLTLYSENTRRPYDNGGTEIRSVGLDCRDTSRTTTTTVW